MNAVGERTVRSGRTKAGAGRSLLASLLVAVFVVAILLVSMILGAALARGQYVTGPNVRNPEPDPYLEGNATISTHLGNYSALQYPSGVGSAILPARLDPGVVNPIQINPSGIVAPGVLQATKVNSLWTNATATWGKSGGQYGAVQGTITAGTSNGQPDIYLTENTSAAGAGASSSYLVLAAAVPNAAFPSANLQFDYVTVVFGLSGPACILSNCYQSISIANASLAGGGTGTQSVAYFASNYTVVSASIGSSSVIKVGVGQVGYLTMPFSIFAANYEGVNLNTAVSSSFNIHVVTVLPKEASTTYTTTLYGFALTTSPLTLGPTTYLWTPATPKAVTTDFFVNVANLTTLTPSFTLTSIAGGGYTAAIIQTPNDLPSSALVFTANAVSVANATAGGPGYVEQVTYNYAMGLPIASGVTYGAFKLADEPMITGAQYAVVTIGGTAYTATYQAYLPAHTYTPVASVSPTTTTYWVAVVYYTGAQWDSISTPPGIFSSGGIEYWWFILIGAIIAVAGGSSAWVTRSERVVRVRKGGGMVALPGQGPEVASKFGRRWRELSRRGTMKARHLAAIIVGLVFMGAGGIAVWALYDGADTTGAIGAFIAGLLLLLVLAMIVFVVYEVAHRVRSRGHRQG